MSTDTATPPGTTGQPPARTLRRALLVGLPTLGLILVTVFLARACEAMTGGRVYSEAEYRAHADRTKRTGADTVERLRPAAYLRGTLPGTRTASAANEETSTSCVDDFGFDKDGVTRDEPGYSWRLRFASRADYLAALDRLRADWKEEGLTVKEIPAENRPGHAPGLPGISTTDHDVELALRQAWYGDEPRVYASGKCMRYR
ncbi:hypothetical protein ACFWXK_31805 [Streptomyces sp. NPDC059070]|uniref:hypothetical protein n=1 Tax=Streptomyces sp. NPDC059070 TaxID=3346713 RepID=UPI00369D31EB